MLRKLSEVSAVLLFCLSVSGAEVFFDDFNSSSVNASYWNIPAWSPATYFGRTQVRVRESSPLPSISGGNVVIPVESFNPSGFSFYGTQLNNNYSLMPGAGITITARLKVNTLQTGLVYAFYAYFPPSSSSNTIHDEVDIAEIIGKYPNGFNTNSYAATSLGTGNPLFVSYPSGSATDYHTYQLQWSPNVMVWLVDGVAVRTINSPSAIPVGPMAVCLNAWAPDSTWPDAYSDTIQPATSAANNQVWSMNVDWVDVQTTYTQTLNSINVTPATANLRAGGATVQLSASTLDQYSNPLTTATVAWASDNPAVASVNASGVVTPVSAGTANITASNGAIKSVASVVSVQPASPYGVQYTTVPRYGALGYVYGKVTGMNSLEYKNWGIAAYDYVGSWWTKPYFGGAVTAIQSDGTFMFNYATGGNDRFSTEIRAYLIPLTFTPPQCGGTSTLPSSLDPYVYADIVRQVIPRVVTQIDLYSDTTLNSIGSTANLYATAMDQDNNSMYVASFNWVSSNTSVATVDANGIVTAVNWGSTNVTALSGSVTSNIVVITVKPPDPVLTTIKVTPTTATVTVGGATAQLTATGYDQYNLPISEAFTWYSTNSSVASVNSSGVVTAVSAGTANISAGSGIIGSNSSFITVNPAPPVLTTIKVTPTTATVTVGGATAQLTATGYDQYLNVIPATVTWVSSNPAIASVNSSGTVTAVAKGTANITASSGSIVSNGSVVTVNSAPPVLTTIKVSPATAVMKAGSTKQMIATTLDQYGNPISATVAWTSSNTSVALVNPAGMVSALSIGNSDIVASSGSVLSVASKISVEAPVLKTILLSPSSISITPGGSDGFIFIQALDQFGDAILADIVWASDDPNVAVPESSGLVTAVSPGFTHIAASSGTVSSNKVAVTVNSVTSIFLKSIVISPKTLTLKSFGASLQLSATGRDKHKQPIFVTFSWTSSKASVASVNSVGVVTPLMAGKAVITASSGKIKAKLTVTVKK